MIKVLLERKVKKANYSKLIDHLIDLRAAALRQTGYVSGETLVKENDLIDVLTISTWISEDHWKAWTTSEKRIELNAVVETLIEGEPKISIYTVPLGEEE